MPGRNPCREASFRVYHRQRCVIPLTGYSNGQQKIPHRPRCQTALLFHTHRSTLFAAAGLWTTWRDPATPVDAPLLHSCVLITTDANDTVRTVHDRMPVLLDDDGVDEWLTDADLAPLHLLRPAANDAVAGVKVGIAVNSTRNRGPQLIDKIGDLPTDSDGSGTLF